MMRLTIIIITMIVVNLTQSYTSDSCEAVLCLAGKLNQQDGGDNCAVPIATYFAIKRFTTDGNFDAGLTAAARLTYLQGCPTAQTAWVERINKAFGHRE